MHGETYRIATLHAELTRKGPGVLLRDIERGKDKQIAALSELCRILAPDILLLTKVDFDLEQRTAAALQSVLQFKHRFTLPPNSMAPTSYDLDGDGRKEDRQTWARYAGEGGMLLLSNYPVKLEFHLNDLLWRDAENAPMPVDASAQPFLSEEARNNIRLVSQGFWILTIMPDHSAPITMIAFQNQTPVFDGPEDLNGLRNLGQLGLISAVLNETYGTIPKGRLIAIGNTNLDPHAGDGDRDAMARLLADERLQDARPQSAPGGANTAFWESPGPMRVSYILPSRDWHVADAGVVWPSEGPLRKFSEQASRHRMVWLDLKPSP